MSSGEDGHALASCSDKITLSLSLVVHTKYILQFNINNIYFKSCKDLVRDNWLGYELNIIFLFYPWHLPFEREPFSSLIFFQESPEWREHGETPFFQAVICSTRCKLYFLPGFNAAKACFRLKSLKHVRQSSDFCHPTGALCFKFYFTPVKEVSLWNFAQSNATVFIISRQKSDDTSENISGCQ